MIRSPQRRHRCAFTLVEILIVVVILGILATVVLASIADVVGDAGRTAFVADLKIYTDAMTLYHAEHSEWPLDGSSGVVPAGFEAYVDVDQWERGTPLGGVWDVEFNDNGVTAAVGVHFDGTGGTKDDAFMQTVDQLKDDGNLASGGFQKIADARYYSVLRD